ncbi:putative Heat shock protein 70 family [Helianthus annuus]|nr:putative Heat shock protein 70 family [Helianthus annuus]
MKVLCHSFVQNLGGRDFDEVLFKHFAAQFNEKYKIDVYSNAPAFVRLRTSCEKVKKVLVQKHHLVSSNLSSKLLERITVPCSMALNDSGLRVDELYAIELVGSGSRIPAITRKLTSFFKKEPTRTLNASESVARGCALRCAMLTPTLPVCDYKIKDSFPYSIAITTPQGECMVFPKGSQFPNQKMVRSIGTTSFRIQVAYTKERDFPAGISHIVGHFGLCGTYKSFVTDTEKEEITNNLQETENWLNEDSDDESEQDYTGTLKDLKRVSGKCYF